ncbi:MAG TPA: response regulator, partial [Pyrinomonadaceae bacterium]
RVAGDGRGEESHDSLDRPAHGGDAEAALPPLVGLRVLLVDDDEDTLEMLRIFVRRAGAEVTAVSSASAALEASESVRPDVVVADIGMPSVDGYEFIQRLRALGPERGGETPAVALTAYAAEADRVRALRTGFNAHLAKPVDPDALVDALVNLAARQTPRGG